DQRHQFNILHPASGQKIDVMIPAASEYDRARFERVVKKPAYPDVDICFSSPEDIILMKMVFFREGGSDKHLRDIAGVLKISGDRIDRGYVANWAARLGVGDIWDAVQKKAAQ